MTTDEIVDAVESVITRIELGSLHTLAAALGAPWHETRDALQQRLLEILAANAGGEDNIEPEAPGQISDAAEWLLTGALAGIIASRLAEANV